MRFPTNVDGHLALTDHEVTAAILEAARSGKGAGHEHARRIVQRKHYRLAYERNPSDVKINPDAAELVFRAACEKFGAGAIRRDRYRQHGSAFDFPVFAKDGRVMSSIAMSEVLQRVPVNALDYVFVEPSKQDDFYNWLKEKRREIIQPEEETDGSVET